MDNDSNYGPFKLDLRLKNTLDAWLKYGTVFLIYRLCNYYFLNNGNDTVLFDKQSIQLVIYILIGFAIYYIAVNPYIPTVMQHPVIQNVLNDSLMFGTVLVSSHLIDAGFNGGSFGNVNWLRNAGLIVLAFATYRVVVEPFVPFDRMTPKIRPIITDWAQFGTFMVAFRFIQGKSVLNLNWLLSVLFALLGFTGYHLVTKRLIKTTKDSITVNEISNTN